MTVIGRAYILPPGKLLDSEDVAIAQTDIGVGLIS